MRPSMLVLVVVFALVAALVGCGGNASTESPAPPAPAPEAVTMVDGDAGPIVFGLSGGIDGRNDTLVVDPDGTVAATSGSEGAGVGKRQLSPVEVAELQGLLDESGLFTAEDRSFEGDITDDFYYAVTFRGVTILAASSAAPEELLPAVSRLTDLLDSIAR